MNVYLDTCVFPQRGPLRSGFISPILALASRGDLTVVVPELVRVEYGNLRRTKAQDAIDELRATWRRAYDHLKLQEIYVPTADEVVDPLLADISQSTEIVALDPADAAEALVREARRTRPARDGRGARDAAIWLTVVRHHQQSGVPGVLVTDNTGDFASESDKTEPHPALITDLGESAERFSFAFRPFDFLEQVAPHRATQGALPDDVGVDAEVTSDLAHILSGSDVFTPEESGLDLSPDYAVWETDPEALSVTGVKVLKAHEIDGDVLARVEISVEALSSTDGQPMPVKVTAWIETDADGSSIIEVESIRRPV